MPGETAKLLRVLVVGAGQIGSRHIQALASIPVVAQVVAVDPSSESRERTVQRWNDVPGHEGKRLESLAGLDEVGHGNFDLAILATSAPGRLEQLRRIVDMGVRRVLAEKLLFQSLAELDEALALCHEARVSLYPNYVYRYASPWRILRERLTGQAFEMRVVAGDIGLATNLPHWLDLCEFLAGSATSEVSITLAKPAYPSKRGGGLVDFAGHARARVACGASISLTFEVGSADPVATIAWRGGEWILNEGAGTVSGTLADASMRLERPMVSRITALALPDIVAGRTILPRIEETSAMNRLLLEAAGRALFGTSRRDSVVPVT